MTPEKLSRCLRDAGLGDLVTVIASLCRPGVLLTSQSAGDADIPIGGTKLGRWPDLPAPAQWPTLGNGSLVPFIAQVGRFRCRRQGT